MEAITSMLGERMRVTLSDGRVMDGRFECIDREMNIIVRDGELGLVMIPGQHVAKCELEK